MLGNVGDGSTIGCWQLLVVRLIDSAGRKAWPLSETMRNREVNCLFGGNFRFPALRSGTRSDLEWGVEEKNAIRVERWRAAADSRNEAFEGFCWKMGLADRLVPDVVGGRQGRRCCRTQKDPGQVEESHRTAAKAR